MREDLVVVHTDKGGLTYQCRIEPSKTALGVKFYCPKCKRYVKGDGKHVFQWWTFHGAEWGGERVKDNAQSV